MFRSADSPEFQIAALSIKDLEKEIRNLMRVIVFHRRAANSLSRYRVIEPSKCAGSHPEAIKKPLRKGSGFFEKDFSNRLSVWRTGSACGHPDDRIFSVPSSAGRG